MRKLSLLAFLAALTFVGCKPSFQKGMDGMEYKIIKSGSGPKLENGNFFQFQMATIYNDGKKDTIFSDTRTSSGAGIESFDTLSIPKGFYMILKDMRKGDSAVVRILTDSAFKNQPMPPFFKPKHWLTTTIKIEDILKTKEEADSARVKSRENAMKMAEAQEKAQLAKDDKLIQDYLKKNNINTIKSPLGTYIQIIEPGTGPKVDTTGVASINYTGKSFEGVMFDSNVDPSSTHKEPLYVNLTNDPSLGNRVIPGWSDALVMLNKGAKAKLFVPSALAYGKQGSPDKIKPNENLMFEIEVTDFYNKEQGRKLVEAQMKKYQELQQKMMDSMQKAQGNIQAPPPATK